jgi:dienelactone hydrolase
MLLEQLGNARQMLAKGGLVIHALILWGAVKGSYFTGTVVQPYGRGTPAWLQALKGAARRVVHMNALGKWFDFPEVASIGAAAEFHVTCYESMLYPYRFHAVFRNSVGSPADVSQG